MSRAQVIPMLLSGLRDTSGNTLAGGLVHTYAVGTTTDQSVYTDQTKLVAATNPVVLDSNGMAQVYADGGYKLVVKDSLGSTLYTWDNLLFGLDDDTSIWGGTSTGSSNAYAITPSPAITALVEGQFFTFLANHTSSGAATLNVNGLGATTLKNTDGTAIGASDITSGGIFEVAYNGTDFQLVGNSLTTPIAVASGGTGDSTASGARTNLGVEIGTDVQAQSAHLDALDSEAKTLNYTPVGDGSTYVTQLIDTTVATIPAIDWSGTPPTVFVVSPMTGSSLTVNQYEYVRFGPFIFFTISLNLTLGGTASGGMYVAVPINGRADNINVNYSFQMIDGGGTSVVDCTWKYVGGSTGSTDGLLITKNSGNFSLGVNAAIHLQGFYLGA